MRRVKKYKLDKQTWEEQQASRNFNPSMVLVYERQRIPIDIGSNDDFALWRARDYMIATSYNSSLDALGGTSYQQDPTGQWSQAYSVYFQNDFAVREFKEHGGLGEINVNNPQLVKALDEYLY